MRTTNALRSYIRILLEDVGMEMTDAERAAKAAVTPKPTAPEQGTPDKPPAQPQEEVDMPPAEVDTLAKRMREKGASEDAVKSMLAAAMGNG